MDEYFTELMIEALNRRLGKKDRIISLEEIMYEKGIKVGKIDQYNKELKNIKIQKESDERGISSAISDSKEYNVIDDNKIRNCWDEITSEYDYRIRVKVTNVLDVDGLEKFLSDKKVSFIVHSGNYIFDGRKSEEWKKGKIREGYDLSLYLKNLGIKKIKIDHLLKYIGEYNIEKEKDEQKIEITDTYIVNLKEGLHCQPASNLVEILEDYKGIIHMKSEITEKDYSGKSIMSILLLGAGYGQELKFTYDVSTPELFEQYKKVSPLVRQILELKK